MSALIAGGLTAAALFTLVALWRLVRRAGHPGAGASLDFPRDERGVLLLRPVDAPTDEELQNLRAPLRGVSSVVLSPSRAALGEGPRWLPSDPLQHNRKLGHLQYALAVLETAGRPVLVADADVRVDEALVNGLLSALASGAELAWAAPRPVAPGLARGLLVQSLHSFEALDVLSGGVKPVCGKAFALGPRALEALRGLPDCLGEDLELARALHAKGLRVVLAGVANLPGAAAPLPVLLARFTRWMQVLKAHRPALFPTIPLLFAATPWLLLAAVVEGSGALLVGALGLVLSRSVLAAVLERRPAVFLAWLPAELLLLACWGRALLLGSRVTWRGRVLQVGLDGRLGRGLAP